MRREREEGLAVRLLVERDPAEAIDDPGAAAFCIETLDLGRDVEVALGAQEEAVLRTAVTADRPHALVQARLGASRAKLKVLRATLCVEAGEDRDRFDQGGLARAVLADEKRDLGIERELVESSDRRNRERIGAEVTDAVADQTHPSQVSTGRMHRGPA